MLDVKGFQWPGSNPPTKDAVCRITATNATFAAAGRTSPVCFPVIAQRRQFRTVHRPLSRRCITSDVSPFPCPSSGNSATGPSHSGTAPEFFQRGSRFVFHLMARPSAFLLCLFSSRFFSRISAAPHISCKSLRSSNSSSFARTSPYSARRVIPSVFASFPLARANGFGAPDPPYRSPSKSPCRLVHRDPLPSQSLHQALILPCSPAPVSSTHPPATHEPSSFPLPLSSPFPLSLVPTC